MIVLRTASEPIFKDMGRPQTEYRTREHGVTLYVEKKAYHVELCNCRGAIETQDFEDKASADSQFDNWMAEFKMEEDKAKYVKQENEKLTLIEMIREYFTAGDWLSDMDSMLDQIKEDISIRYSYKNLYTNTSGFFAHVKIHKRGKQDKVEVFIKGDDFGHFVEHIKIKP